MTFPRIAYEAFKLHFQKRLDVYGRPEPVPVELSVERDGGLRPVWNPVEFECQPSQLAATEKDSMGGTIGYLPPGRLETWAHSRVVNYLSQNTVLASPASPNVWEQDAVIVELVSTRAGEPIERVHLSHLGNVENLTAKSPPTLRITYRSHRLFTILLLAPTPQHALLAGVEGDRIFSASDDELFCRVFASLPALLAPSGLIGRYITSLRTDWARGAWNEDVSRMPSSVLVRSTSPNSAPSLADGDAAKHSTSSVDFPLNSALPSPSLASSLRLSFVLSLLLLTDWLEKQVFRLLKARFVPGDEPWNVWDRAHAALNYSVGQNLLEHREEHADGISSLLGQKAEHLGHLAIHRPLGSVRRA